MREKILVIHDNKDFAYFVMENLQLISNYAVLIAPKGKRGIRKALKENPDLVLLGMIKPGSDGYKALKRLKENKKTSHIPVIMVAPESDDESRFNESGCSPDDHIFKPVQIREIKEKIKRILSMGI